MQGGSVVRASASTSKLTIDRIDSDEIDYAAFCERYLKGNQPCIFSPTLIADWAALNDWTSSSSSSSSADGDVNGLDKGRSAFDKLARYYRDHTAPVIVDNGEERNEMSIADAVSLIKTGEEHVYIKDWHLVRQERIKRGPQTRSPYQVPGFFVDDWMNNRRIDEDDDDDFRFCYAGTAGTRTNIHRDVYTSYSWSTNVIGRKLWRLFPPSTKRHLRKYPDVPTSELAPCVDQLEEWAAKGELGHVRDGKKGWPEWASAMQQCIDVIQEAKETIFVPSDWHHEVTNLTDCISINHNWCNSTNIASMYRSMCMEVDHVEEALCDVKTMMMKQLNWQVEWTATVQQVLASNAGWAWEQFWAMVEHNLQSPSCPTALRPCPAYVAEQLRPCLDEFVLRHDFSFLSEATRDACRSCNKLLNERQE